MQGLSVFQVSIVRYQVSARCRNRAHPLAWQTGMSAPLVEEIGEWKAQARCGGPVLAWWNC